MRFLEPDVVGTAEVRIRLRSRSQLAGYILNYQRSDRRHVTLAPTRPCRVTGTTRTITFISLRRRYKMLDHNCQTFAADFFGFLTGKNAKPYHLQGQFFYQPRREAFVLQPRSRL